MPSAAARLPLAVLCAFLVVPALTWGQGTAQPLIVQAVDESHLIALPGNTHPLARAEFDQGAAPPDLPMQRMLLVLKRSPDQETALLKLLDDQQDKASPIYHKWLTPEQFGRQFGPADQDILTITSWLQGHGFQTIQVTKGRTVIEFSGSASQVQETFHTAIHKYAVNGEERWANASDPQIPVALGPVVAGVATLHNFLKQPLVKISKTRIQAKLEKGSHPLLTFSDGTHALTPGDFEKIYNILPVASQGITGVGITIAVLGRSNVFNGGQDVGDFRNAFGGGNSPNIILNGPDPGDLGGGEEVEATLDNTWAGALAPNALIDFVLSASTNTTDGVDLSEVYAIDNNLAPIMTESFSICESGNADLLNEENLAEQAASQGITYFVSSGDSGAAGCDDPNFPPATQGASVNALASTQFTVAVGGTEFNDNGNPAAYWGAQNSADGSSVLSYIPENVWNESGPTLGLWSSGGGASSRPKPTWQSGTGVPADSHRDVPDVSLTAAGHDGYLLCLEGSCVPDSQGFISLFLIGGTSASAPSFASIMALVDQKMGSPQGQADYVLYPLAAAEASTLSQCNASKTPGPPQSSCVFNDVTVGNNSVPGLAGFNATVGYDEVTGLGSVNVTNLVNAWNATTFRATTATLTPASITAAHGAPVTLNVSVAPNSGTGTPTGDASLQTGLISAPGFIDVFPAAQAGFLALINGSASSTVNDLPGGTYTLTAQYAGDAVFAPSPPSSPINVTISAENSNTTLTLLTIDQSGNLIPFSGGPFGSFVYVRADVSAQSGHGTPTGSVAFADQGNIVGVLNLNSEGNVATPNGYFGFTAGQHSLVAQYRADNSFDTSSSTPAASFTTTQAFTSTTLAPVSGAVLGNDVTLTANIASPAFAGAPSNFCTNMPCESTSNYPSGTVRIFAGSTQVGTAAVNQNQVTANGVTAVASFSTSVLPLGQSSITVQYIGDSNYTSSTSPLVTVNVQPDFSVSAGAPIINISAPGKSGTLAIAITGSSGYSSTISFTSSSCSGLPAESQCSFNPGSLTGSGQTTLTVLTTAPRSAALRGFERWTTGFGLVFAGVVLLGVPPKRRRLGAMLSLAVCAFVLTSVSCGGSNNGGGGGVGDPGTPPGSSIVTVTATTATGLSHPVTFTLNVGP